MHCRQLQKTDTLPIPLSSALHTSLGIYWDSSMEMEEEEMGMEAQGTEEGDKEKGVEEKEASVEMEGWEKGEEEMEKAEEEMGREEEEMVVEGD